MPTQLNDIAGSSTAIAEVPVVLKALGDPMRDRLMESIRQAEYERLNPSLARDAMNFLSGNKLAMVGATATVALGAVGLAYWVFKSHRDKQSPETGISA